MRKNYRLFAAILLFSLILLGDSQDLYAMTIHDCETQAFVNFKNDLEKRGVPPEVAQCMAERMEENLPPDVKMFFIQQMNLACYNKSFFIKWFVDTMSSKYENQAKFVQTMADDQVRIMENAQNECRKKFGYD